MTRNKIIQQKSLQGFESNTNYYGCAFFLEEGTFWEVENSVFDNCSFRTSVTFSDIKHCQFTNCTVSERFVVKPKCTNIFSWLSEFVTTNAPVTDFYWENSLPRDILANEICLPEAIATYTSLKTFVLKISQGVYRGYKLSLKPICSLLALERLEVGTACQHTIVVPSEIKNLRNLKHLMLESCRALPKEIAELHKLQSLCLKSYMFADFPDVIFQCKKLESLSISGGSFVFGSAKPVYDRLNKSFAKLVNLKTLSIDCFEIDKLPESIALLPNLTTLHFNDPIIKSWPKNGFKHLENLSLKHCDGLDELPCVFYNAKGLQNLDIINASFSRLPSLTEFPQLYSLSVNNALFEPAISKLPKLEKLSLMLEQGAEKLPESLNDSLSIRSLILDNAVFDPSVRDYRAPNLLLDIASLCERLESLTMIYCNMNQAFDDLVFKQLKYLDVSNSEMCQATILSISRLHRLEELSLSAINHQTSGYYYLPDEMIKMPLLKKIIVDKDDAFEIPKHFYDKESLKIIRQ